MSSKRNAEGEVLTRKDTKVGARRGRGRKAKSAQSRFKLSKADPGTVKALADILETKKYHGLIPNPSGTKFLESKIVQGHIDNQATVLPVYCFQKMFPSSTVHETTPDLAGTCMEGDSLFCKYLSLKVQVDYPDGAFAPNRTARPVELVWGWVNPLNLTPFTTPTESTVTTQQIVDHIVNTVSREFDNQNEPLQFHDKHKRLYNVIGRHKFLPDMRMQAPSQVTYLASASKMLKTITWPMEKKIRYTHSNEGQSPGTLGNEFMYPNEAYLPFAILFNPDQSFYGDTTDTQIEYKWNDCMWYNDA